MKHLMACDALPERLADSGFFGEKDVVLDQWKMGVLGETSLIGMASSSQARDFLLWGREKPAACHDCRWFRICNGGCKNDWERTGEPKNHYCEALRLFFAHAEQRLVRVAREELRCRQMHQMR